ncbi:MAG: FAD-binding protein [Chitinophagaceae bacterium]|nr:FAD-binding protein [Chitinophagaceae bacterium]
MPPVTNLPDGIERFAITKWTNGHQNFTHTFQKDTSFKLRIPFNPPTMSEQYKATTANFQWLIQYAIDNNIKLRAMGNGWSFSDVAVCDGGVIDTKALRLSFWIPQKFISQDYLNTGKGPADLFFTQCGMSILDLNEKLEKKPDPKRALRASGASNGQSVAGATSTGTHGSAFRVGAVHDTIVGLHLVVSPTRHVWLERASYPVASNDLINWIGAELIRDDDMFNAALVSFGSFGFIHGILLETDPIYLLSEQRADEITYDDALIKAIDHLDFSDILLQLPYPPDGTDKELYHFEVIVNPHKFEKDNDAKGVYLKTMYKIPYTPNYPKRVRDDDPRFQYGDNTLGVIQAVLDALPQPLQVLAVPALVNALFPLAFKSAVDAFGTIGETFSNPKFRGQATSAAIGIDSKDASKVIDEIVDINKQSPFPGGLALRYVKGTKALLGFTKFEKTCILELDGVESQVARNFFQKIWDRLEAKNIPYTLHWGKMNFNLTPQRVRNMYSDAAVDKWIACRHALLDAPSRNVFNNAFMQRCGLDV